MKLFLGKNWPSLIFLVSLTVFGVFIALILVGEQNQKQQLGSIIGAISSFGTAVSMYLTILKKNKETGD